MLSLNGTNVHSTQGPLPLTLPVSDAQPEWKHPLSIYRQVIYHQKAGVLEIITGNAHTAYRPGDYTCGVPSTVTGYASCHSLSPENATHRADTGVQVLIYMGQMRPASSSVGGSVDGRLDSHTYFHLQQKIEYKSVFNGNDYTKVVYLGLEVHVYDTPACSLI